MSLMLLRSCFSVTIHQNTPVCILSQWYSLLQEVLLHLSIRFVAWRKMDPTVLKLLPYKLTYVCWYKVGQNLPFHLHLLSLNSKSLCATGAPCCTQSNVLKFIWGRRCKDSDKSVLLDYYQTTVVSKGCKPSENLNVLKIIQKSTEVLCRFFSPSSLLHPPQNKVLCLSIKIIRDIVVLLLLMLCYSVRWCFISV